MESFGWISSIRLPPDIRVDLEPSVSRMVVGDPTQRQERFGAPQGKFSVSADAARTRRMGVWIDGFSRRPRAMRRKGRRSPGTVVARGDVVLGCERSIGGGIALFGVLNSNIFTLFLGGNRHLYEEVLVKILP